MVSVLAYKFHDRWKYATVHGQRQATQDKSEQKDMTMEVPITERLRRCRLRGPTTCSGTLAQFGRMVLKSERKTKGPCLGLFETRKRRREKGGTGEGSLASQQGRCRSIYALCTCKLRWNEIEQNEVKWDMSNEIEGSKVIWRHAMWLVAMRVELDQGWGVWMYWGQWVFVECKGCESVVWKENKLGSLTKGKV